MAGTVDNLNEMLRLAGVATTDLKVLTCLPEGPCKVRVKENKKEEIFTPLKVNDVFTLVNDWVARNPQSAKNHFGNSAKLFQTLNSSWVLVDTDITSGADEVLYQSSSGEWKYLPGNLDTRLMEEETLRWVKKIEAAITQSANSEELTTQIFKSSRPGVELAKFLEKTSWKDLDLKATPTEFGDKVYPFEVTEDPKAPPFLSPFHKVNLTWHPEVVVPWSDPYLLMEWQAFLQSSGVEVKKARPEDPPEDAQYFYKGLLLMDSQRVSEGIRFRYYRPIGTLEREVVVKREEKPKVEVRHPSDAQAAYFQVTVYGRPLSLWAYFPETKSKSEQETSIRKIGETLQRIPESMIVPLLEGVGAEAPLRILLADKARAKEIGWLPPASDQSGGYHSENNLFWVTPTDSPEPFLHDVGGHAYADYFISRDNESSLTDPGQSALRDYYVWKLSQLFLASDLSKYDELSTRFRQGVDQGNLEAQEKAKLEQALQPYRNKAKKLFVSDYAIEGARGISFHTANPYEDFAEVMTEFYSRLHGIHYADPDRGPEPLLKLIGMDYLFHEYKVTSIGRISQPEVYSRKAFEIVLGLDLDKVDPAVFPALGLKPPGALPKLSGFVLPLVGGYQWFRLSTPRGTETADAGYGGIFPGYRGEHLGLGASLEFYHYEQTKGLGSKEAASLWDVGVWGQISTQVGPAHFFFEPTLGLRHAVLDKENQNSFWIGGNAGLGFFGNGFGFRLQTKTDLTSGTGAQNLGASIFLDIPSLIRFSAQQF